MTYVVGITGGIGAGKTTVSGYLAEMGADIIDTDNIARQLTLTDVSVIDEIKAVFGDGLYNEIGELDRKRLAGIVFADRKQLEVLNDILHPRIRECWEKRLDESESTFVFVVIPLLFEKNLEDRFDEIWVVTASEDERIRRVIERDAMTRDEVLDRMKHQVPVGVKIERADIVIDSSGGFDKLREDVTASLQDLKRRLGLEAQS